MKKKYRLFGDVTSVSQGERTVLKNLELLNDNDTVIGWSRLAPKLRDREVSHRQAKILILIELNQPEPRLDTIRRLVSYLSYSGKEQTMDEIEKILDTKQN